MAQRKWELVHEIVGGEPYAYYPLGEHIVAAPGVCGGRPTFKYTRIEITGALDRLAAGETVEESVAAYQGRGHPDADPEAGRLAAAQFARNLPALESVV